jgi:cell division protein FtsB
MLVKRSSFSATITSAHSRPSACSRGLRKELEQLHARRMAITNLIESLEDYDRFRVRHIADSRLKTA